MTSAQSIITGSGLLLFVVGLLNGVVISRTRSPRLSLSAHLTAVQSGTFLIAIAWAWPVFEMGPTFSMLVAYGLCGALFVLWAAFFLAGLWGAGHGLAIAGQGSETTEIRQAIVTALLGLGVVGTLGASLVLLFQSIEALNDEIPESFASPQARWNDAMIVERARYSAAPQGENPV